MGGWLFRFDRENAHRDLIGRCRNPDNPNHRFERCRDGRQTVEKETPGACIIIGGWLFRFDLENALRNLSGALPQPRQS
jgi:hypothetical protein